MTMNCLCSLLALASLSASVERAAAYQQPLVVSLWHTYVQDADTTLFWASSSAPVLADSPEFLHTRQVSPSGVAFEVDVDEDRIRLTVADASGAVQAAMPAGQFDRYYLFWDDTESIDSIALVESPFANVRVEVVDAGSLIQARDKSSPIFELELEVPEDAILIELGPETPLTGDLVVEVSFRRTVKPPPPVEDHAVAGLQETAPASGAVAVPVAALLATVTTSVLAALLL
jgi:hypothetical protein